MNNEEIQKMFNNRLSEKDIKDLKELAKELVKADRERANKKRWDIKDLADETSELSIAMKELEDETSSLSIYMNAKMARRIKASGKDMPMSIAIKGLAERKAWCSMENTKKVLRRNKQFRTMEQMRFYQVELYQDKKHYENKFSWRLLESAQKRIGCEKSHRTFNGGGLDIVKAYHVEAWKEAYGIEIDINVEKSLANPSIRCHPWSKIPR